MLFLVPNVRRLGWLQGFPQALLFILLIAALSYYFVEKPMLRIGHRLASVRTGRPERSAPVEEQLSAAQVL
jgi:peptidoglycan/LPS O-acetylase OafA/YrhL